MRLRIPSLPYAVSCGQVVKSSSSRPASRSRSTSSSSRRCGCSTVFTDADYDMSIVAHVEPRDLPPVFGDPTYYTRYDNKKLQADLAAADSGTPEEQVTLMKKAARDVSRTRRATWLFVLPNLMVADEGHHRAPEERHHRVVRARRPGEVRRCGAAGHDWPVLRDP